MAGMDLLLDSLLRLGGVNVEDAKKQMHDFAKKFVEQDTLLREIHAQQKEQNVLLREIRAALVYNITPAVEGGTTNGEIVADGYGQSINGISREPIV